MQALRLTDDKKKFYGTICKIAIPVILQNMITMGVNLMDTVMLGSYGEVQLSGSSLANDFINIFHILCMGMGGGAAVLTAQYWGAGDIPSLKKSITIMLRFCFALAALFTIVTFFFPGFIVGIFTSEADVIEKGILYLRISAFSYIFMGLSLTLSIVLRSVRQAKVPMYMAIAAFFVNIFFNWVFIFGKLGAPEMQIEGAALGTLIARIVEAGILVVYLLKFDTKIKYRLKDLFAKCGDLVKVYFRYSLPVIGSDGLLALGNSMVAIIGGHISKEFVAANAIIALVVRLTTVFNQGISIASSTLTGNTLGTGDKDRAYREGKSMIFLSFCAGVFAALLVLAFTPMILSMYNITPETLAIARELMYAVIVMVVFQALQSVTTKGVLRGGGDTLFLMVADVLFLWCASVPLGYCVALVWKLPPFWVYCSLKIDWIIKSLWCLYRFRTRKWMRVVKRES